MAEREEHSYCYWPLTSSDQSSGHEVDCLLYLNISHRAMSELSYGVGTRLGNDRRILLYGPHPVHALTQAYMLKPRSLPVACVPIR